MGLFKKVKKAVKKGGRSIGRGAARTYRGTAGKAIRNPDVSPRKAFRAARRINPLRGVIKTAKTLKKRTKPKGGRPRR